MASVSTADETRVAAGRGSPVNVGLTLAPLMLGALAYGVLGTVVAPALPFFADTFHTSETGAAWLLTSYLLAAAAATAIVGRIGDMFGKRRTLLVVLAILAAGTLICAVSNSLGLQLLGRTMQGAAGGLFPLAFGIIRDEFPPDRVAGGIGAIAGMIGLGGIGVILPGLLVPHVSWHWLYWIPLILTLASLAGTWVFVRESANRPGGRVNWGNGALMVVGITATVLGISQGGEWGWGSGKTIGLLGGGLAVCAIWVVAESRSAEPLIDMKLMKLRGVWSTNLVAFLIGAGMYAAFAVYPVFAQLPSDTGFAYGASMLQTGLYLLPLSVGAAVFSVLASRSVQRFGSVATLVAGCVLTAAGFGYMAIWHSHPYDMMVSLGLVGAGIGLSVPTISAVVVHSVPAQSVGQAMGMNTVVRMIGGAVGTQVVSSIMTGSAQNGVPTLDGFTGSYASLAAFLAVAILAGLAASHPGVDVGSAGQSEAVAGH